MSIEPAGKVVQSKRGFRIFCHCLEKKSCLSTGAIVGNPLILCTLTMMSFLYSFCDEKREPRIGIGKGD